MTTSPPTLKEREAFYAAAVLGLRALDAREPTARRFGPDADARWSQFAGALGAGDRLDILLRDAAGKWGAAFSPSDCFGFFGLADDEPFGPDWAGLEDAAAKTLLAEMGSPPVTIAGAAAILGVNPAPVSVPTLTKSTKVVVAGGAALVTVAKAFAENRDLSWTDQVAVVVDKASFRQIAGLAAVLLGARARTAMVHTSADAATALGAAGFAHIDAAVVSPDAEPGAAEFARSVGG